MAWLVSSADPHHIVEARQGVAEVALMPWDNLSGAVVQCLTDMVLARHMAMVLLT